MCCVPSLWFILFGSVGVVQSKWMVFRPQNQTEHPWLRKPGESVRRELLGAYPIERPWDDDWEDDRNKTVIPPLSGFRDGPKNLVNFYILFAFANIVTLLVLMTLTIHYTCGRIRVQSYSEDIDEETASLAHVA